MNKWIFIFSAILGRRRQLQGPSQHMGNLGVKSIQIRPNTDQSSTPHISELESPKRPSSQWDSLCSWDMASSQGLNGCGGFSSSGPGRLIASQRPSLTLRAVFVLAKTADTCRDFFSYLFSFLLVLRVRHEGLWKHVRCDNVGG